MSNLLTKLVELLTSCLLGLHILGILVVLGVPEVQEHWQLMISDHSIKKEKILCVKIHPFSVTV